MVIMYVILFVIEYLYSLIFYSHIYKKDLPHPLNWWYYLKIDKYHHQYDLKNRMFMNIEESIYCNANRIRYNKGFDK